MEIQFILLLGLTAFFFGCSTTEDQISRSSNPTRPEMPEKGRAKAKDVRLWTQYYLDTGTAKDMAEAQKMAREMFWPDIEDTTSTLAKIEENNEALRKQLIENKK